MALIALSHSLLAPSPLVYSAQDEQPICVAPEYGNDCLTLNETYAVRLLTDLFGSDEQIFKGTAHYTADAVPTKSSSEPLSLHISNFLVRSISELDDREQTLKAVMYLQLMWTDPFLSWDPEQYGGVSMVPLAIDKVWWPNFLVTTSVLPPKEEMNGGEGITMSLFANGGISFLDPRATETSCPLKLANFPFDEQTCLIEMINYLHDTESLTIDSLNLNPDSYKASVSAWNVTNIDALILVECYNSLGIAIAETEEAAKAMLSDADPVKNCYNFLRVEIKFKRYAEPYVTMSIIPVAFVTFLTFISFLLPTGAGERTGLIITALLTVVAVMFITAEKLPETKETTILDTFNKVMVLLNLLVMLQAGFVILLGQYNFQIDVLKWKLVLIYPELWDWTRLGKLVRSDGAGAGKASPTAVLPPART
ncbi:hypothetical protein CYMTET_4246 [Cymbomonas tetramitiformis]|uniref:Neurotransmitter-gated ion-channel ligand-binding domain-containing protein n=1 Tax=Cymbomonas tetramitiformis TaxID=36881 RepID=A0AAE0LKP5_9CHLO|nr:hypothetical protein CYMTET_4246 [Cymbomonas tetramitiformis]